MPAHGRAGLAPAVWLTAAAPPPPVVYEPYPPIAPDWPKSSRAAEGRGGIPPALGRAGLPCRPLAAGAIPGGDRRVA
jgi:hypothetical protein